MSIPQYYQDVNRGKLLGRTGLPMMFPRISRTGRVAWKDHETGNAIIDGVLKPYPLPTVGNWPLAWGPDDSLYLRVLNGATVEYRRLLVDGTDLQLDLGGRDDAEGFNRITDDHHVILNNDPSCWRTVAGIPLSRCSDDGAGTIVGLADGMGPHGCVVVVRDGVARAWEAPDDVPHPPHVLDGLIAVSGPEPPPIGDGQDWPLWRPYVAPVVPPSRPALPPVPDMTKPMWIGGDNSKGYVPGNCAWGADAVPGALPDPRPVTEMSPWASTIEGRDLLMGLWLSDNNAAPETVDAEIAFAKSRRAKAVYLHEDDTAHRARVITTSTRVGEAELAPYWGLTVNEGVPSGWPGGRQDCHGITLNIRTYGKDPAKLLEGVVWAVDQCRQGNVAVLLIFGWADCDWPELKSWLSAVMAKVPTPTRKPGEPDRPAPIVVPPVDRPQPVRPKPNRGPAIAAAASAIAAFVGWLFRRRHKP